MLSFSKSALLLITVFINGIDSNKCYNNSSPIEYFKMMKTSKIQQLVEINDEYHKKTAEYVEKNHNFIEEFIKKLALNLYVKVNEELVLINSARETISERQTIGNFITIRNDCFFEFLLRLKM